MSDQDILNPVNTEKDAQEESVDESEGEILHARAIEWSQIGIIQSCHIHLS